MKKILILAILALVAGGMVFAEVTVGGYGQFGITTDGEQSSVGYLSDISISGGSDYVTTMFVARYRDAYWGATEETLFRKMYGHVDAAGALGLDGFGWQLRVGKDGDYHLANAFGAANAFGGFGRVARFSDNLWGVRNVFTFAEMLNVRALIGGVEANDEIMDWAMKFGVDGSVSGVDFAVNAEKGAAVEFGDMNLGFAAAYTIDLDGTKIGVGGNFMLPLAEGAIWSMGAGAKVTMDMLTAGVTLAGNEDSVTDLLGVIANFKAMDALTLRAGAVMDLTGDRDDALQEILVGASTGIGAMGVHVGYVINNGSTNVQDALWTSGPNAYDNTAPASAQSGVYLSFTYNW